MRKVRNRGISLLLVLVLLLGLLPGAAWGANDPIGSVTFSIETKTIDGNYLVEPMEEELYAGDTVYTILSRVAEEKGIPVEGADTGYVTKIGSFGSYTDSDYGLESGWMALLNNDYETWPLPELKDGDSVRFCYTYKTYGHDIDLIDLVEELEEKVTLASEYTGSNEEAVYAALEVAAEKLGEIQSFDSNQDYIDSLDTMVYGPGSDTEIIQGLIRRLDITLGGEEYIPVSSVEIQVLESDGTPATSYATNRSYQLKAVFEPENASWQEGSWAVVTGMGAEATVTPEGVLTITGLTDEMGGLHMLTIQFKNAELSGGKVSKVLSGIQEGKADADYVNQAKEALTWESIRGSNTDSAAVTTDLAIPSQLTVGEETVSVSWSCDDTTGALSVSNYYGSWGAYVDRPAAQDVTCTLTATLTYGTASATKEFPITIKAEGVNPDKESVVSYGPLMTGIAAGYAASTDPWVVLEMAAYNGSNVKGDASYNYASDAVLALANAAIGQPDASSLAAVDVSGPYAIYTVPYLAMAYRASGVEGTGTHSPSALNETMVAYLNAVPGNGAGVDEVAPVLSALAPYYKTGDTALDAAVDAGIAWLSSQQNSDGTFSYYGTSNANSTAMAIVALSALGIDAHTDSRFVKDGKSAVEGLFSFALPDHSGLGYKGNVTRSDLATEQGFRALVAYARMKANNAPYNIYIQAKDSVDTVAAPNISATVDPGEGGDQGGEGGTPTVQVTVSVMVPPEGGAEGQYTYKHDASLYSNLLGSAKTQTVTLGTTALSVLTSALGEAHISYTQSGGYISNIGGLKEGDHGPNSGWQYMVNGTVPTESASTYTFFSNASLVWYYTDDYTKEKGSESWGGGEEEEKPEETDKVQVTPKGDGTYEVVLPEESTGSVVVTIPEVDQGQVVVIVHPDGTEEVVKKSVVQDGTAYLMLEEDAKVKVVDYTNDFEDVAADAWYASSVEFVAGRGLFSGVDEGHFAPEGMLNRAMVVTVLYALEDGAKQNTQGLFEDVAQDAWYAQGTAWAVEEGIVSGYGDGRFGPDDAVTREQLALMLYRYAQSLGENTQGSSSLASFKDGGEVSSWATQAMSWAVSAGILSGGSDGSLNPGGTATRAEAATMVRQFVSWMLQN